MERWIKWRVRDRRSSNVMFVVGQSDGHKADSVVNKRCYKDKVKERQTNGEF